MVSVRSQGRREANSIARVPHLALEILKEIIAVMVDRFAAVGRDQDVAVPSVGGGASGGPLNGVSHVGSVPVDVALAPAHVEGMHHLESHLLCGSVGVVDTVYLPPKTTLAIRWHPVHGEPIDADLLRGFDVGLPLLVVVGEGVLDHEMRHDGGSRRYPERACRKQEEGRCAGEHVDDG